jgi:predicted small integral membrane protein
MSTTRVVKTVMVGSTALFALMVAVNNLVDYESNFQFVRHVLSMDTTFPGNALRWRGIASPVFWTLAYWSIIAAEAVVGCLLAYATAQLAMKLRSSARNFNAAKKYAIAAVGLGFLLWFTGFMVVGGEWFAMWQSKEWNGLQAAFRFDVILLVVVIFLNQPDGELDA